MASRNVDLLIRARENASRAFKSVSDALDELAVVQGEVASKAGKVDDALNQTQTSARKVATAIGADVTKGVEKAAKVFERIERTVAESSDQFEKQKQDLLENKEAYNALGKQAEAAATAIKRSEDKIGPQTEEQTARLKVMRDAYTALTREIGTLTPKLAKQENALEQNAVELDRIRNAALAASAALREVGRSSSTAQGLNSQKAQTDAANQSAQQGLAKLARAERAIQIEINAREEAAREAAAASEAANQQIVASVQEVIRSEQRLEAIQAQRAKMQAAEGVNASAKAGLAGITAGLISKTRAEEAASQAAAAHGRAMAALEASYSRQRAAARPSVSDQKELAQAFRTSFTAAQQAKTPLEQLYNEIARLGPASDQGANGVRRLTSQMVSGRQAFRAFYGDSRKALSLMQRIRGEVLSLTASFVGFYGVFNVGQGIFEAFTKLEAAQNRLGAAFNQDYGKVNDEMARLQAEASRLGISFDTLADNYSKFIISGQQAGLGVEDLRKTFTQVAEAGRVLKLSNDQIEGTFNALIQIAGKGTLQMEELRQQLGDRIPGAVGIMAKALGYGEDQLSKFYKDVENGLVSADDALVAFGNGLDATFGDQLEDALDSTITKVGELKNLFFQRQLTAANAGFIDGLDVALEALNKFLASEEGIEYFEQLGAAFGRVFETLPVVLDNLDTLGLLLQGFIAIKAGQVVSQLAGNFVGLGRVTIANQRVQVALNRTVAAFSPSAAAALRSSTALGAGLRGLRAAAAGLIVTLRAAFLSLGGIIGIAASALSYFAFNSLTSVDESSKATSEALSSHADIVRDVKEAYDEAKGSAEGFKKKLEDLSKIEAEASLKRLRGELAAFRSDESNTYSTQKGGSPEVRAELQERGDKLGVRSLIDNLLEADRAFTDGEGSARDLLKAIQEINQASPDLLPIEIQERIEQIAKEGIQMEDALAEAEAVLRVLNGTATDADEVLLGLRDATDSAATAGEKAAKKFSAFEEAMRELAKQVPSLNRELEKFDKIAKIEASFQAALKAAQALPDAIMRIAAAQEALSTKNLALQSLDAEEVAEFDGTDGVKVAAAVLRKFEGRLETPKYDVNALRAGYGSDTRTLADGSFEKITAGMTVTLKQANDDLLRRITTEFLPKVRAQVGGERFELVQCAAAGRADLYRVQLRRTARADYRRRTDGHKGRSGQRHSRIGRGQQRRQPRPPEQRGRAVLLERWRGQRACRFAGCGRRARQGGTRPAGEAGRVP
ncbi:tape measure protein [Sulfitobacter pontiacus]